MPLHVVRIPRKGRAFIKMIRNQFHGIIFPLRLCLGRAIFIRNLFFMIIPLIRSSEMTRSIRFYTVMLDFELAFSDSDGQGPAFATLKRGNDYIYLSSHSGDGVFGGAVYVAVDNVDRLIEELRERGLPPSKKDSPVHQGAVDQTWGTREFYVDDPDGNTIRFVSYPNPS
jgi:catechol 2,3-dioxygenase-like lactoylglutathione lyase family enzyme